MLPRAVPISKVRVGKTMPVWVTKPPVAMRNVPIALSTMVKFAALAAPPSNVRPEVPVTSVVPAYPTPLPGRAAKVAPALTVMAVLPRLPVKARVPPLTVVVPV